MNQSQTKQRRNWLKWYGSGAVPTTIPQFPEYSLVVDKIHTHVDGPAKGYLSITLAQRYDQDFYTTCHFIIPSDKRQEKKTVYRKVPGYAIPASFFFPDKRS